MESWMIGNPVSTNIKRLKNEKRLTSVRTEAEEKEVLVRPEWMDKPKEEMSEEERRLVKEFEKKVAIFKVHKRGAFQLIY